MAPQTALFQCVAFLNFALEDKIHPVKIELRGMSLNIRAKLPSKEPGGKPSMQRLSLGIKADQPGLKTALKTALKIQDQLKTNSFQWRDYDSNYYSQESTEKSLEQFEESFFNEPKRKQNLNSTNATWKGAYREIDLAAVVWNNDVVEASILSGVTFSRFASTPLWCFLTFNG